METKVKVVKSKGRVNGNTRSKSGWANSRNPQWLREPQLGRVVDGIPTGLDELRIGGLGNSIVPQIEELLFRQIDD